MNRVLRRSDLQCPLNKTNSVCLRLSPGLAKKKKEPFTLDKNESNIDFKRSQGVEFCMETKDRIKDSSENVSRPTVTNMSPAKTSSDNVLDGDMSLDNEIRVKEIIKCMQNSDDFVHIASFKSAQHLQHFLLSISKMNNSVALELITDDSESTTVIFQVLKDFKQDFMMLNLSNTEYMLFLRPF